MRQVPRPTSASRASDYAGWARRSAQAAARAGRARAASPCASARCRADARHDRGDRARVARVRLVLGNGARPRSTRRARPIVTGRNSRSASAARKAAAVAGAAGIAWSPCAAQFTNTRPAHIRQPPGGRERQFLVRAESGGGGRVGGWRRSGRGRFCSLRAKLALAEAAVAELVSYVRCSPASRSCSGCGPCRKALARDPARDMFAEARARERQRF